MAGFLADILAYFLTDTDFFAWRRRGEGPRASKRYSAFALAVSQAAAQARLGAEISIREDKPLDWLRNGPGRETAERPGWTSLARPRSVTAASTPVLLDSSIQALLANLLRSLEPQPEVRAIVAAAIEDSSENVVHGD